MGFDWVWFLSVWQTGPAGQRISRSNPEWRREFQETLPDLREEDIPGSGFAITGYSVHSNQNKMARFLENHDEPRAAATFSPAVHEAAAVITFLAPGLHFFHQGQFEGRKKRISPHLCRGPCEPVDPRLQQFYEQLRAVLRQPAVRQGKWQLLQCAPAWEGNWTWDCFVAFAWQGMGGERLLVAVNYSPNQSQCYVQLANPDLAGGQWRLQDQIGTAAYDRDGNDLQSRGLYLDMHPWQCSVFSLTRGL